MSKPQAMKQETPPPLPPPVPSRMDTILLAGGRFNGKRVPHPPQSETLINIDGARYGVRYLYGRDGDPVALWVSLATTPGNALKQLLDLIEG